MRRTDREEDRMCDGDDNESPYLRPPLRGYANVIRDRESKAGRAKPDGGHAASLETSRQIPDDAAWGEQ